MGLRQDLHQHGLSQAVEGHHHRQAAAELGDQAELNEVPRLHQAQQGVFLFVVRGRVAAVSLVALVRFRGSSSALAAQCGGSKTQVLWTQQSVIVYGQLHSMGLPNPGTHTGGSKTQVLWTQQSVIVYGQLHSGGSQTQLLWTQHSYCKDSFTAWGSKTQVLWTEQSAIVYGQLHNWG